MLLAKKKEENRLENELAIKIADILIKEKAKKEKKNNGKKATSFLKEALPVQQYNYASNSVFRRFVQVSALFLVLEQLFIFGTAFDMWGNGSKSMLLVTRL